MYSPIFCRWLCKEGCNLSTAFSTVSVRWASCSVTLHLIHSGISQSAQFSITGWGRKEKNMCWAVPYKATQVPVSMAVCQTKISTQHQIQSLKLSNLVLYKYKVNSNMTQIRAHLWGWRFKPRTLCEQGGSCLWMVSCLQGRTLTPTVCTGFLRP